VHRIVLTGLLLLAANARAEDCAITAGPRDRIAQSGDVVVEAGETVENAMALNGNVIIHKGARVKSAVAVNGNVIIEARAKVTETAATLGGKIKLAPDARIQGSKLELANGFKVTGEDGKKVVDLKLSIDGRSVTDLLLAEMVEQARTCRVQMGKETDISL
jgi:hypothetical protein